MSVFLPSSFISLHFPFFTILILPERGYIGASAAFHTPLTQADIDNLKTLCTVQPKNGRLRTLWSLIASFHSPDLDEDSYSCPYEAVPFLLPLVTKSLCFAGMAVCLCWFVVCRHLSRAFFPHHAVCFKPQEQKDMLQKLLAGGASTKTDAQLNAQMRDLCPPWFDSAELMGGSFAAKYCPVFTDLISMIDNNVRPLHFSIYIVILNLTLTARPIRQRESQGIGSRRRFSSHMSRLLPSFRPQKKPSFRMNRHSSTSMRLLTLC